MVSAILSGFSSAWLVSMPVSVCLKVSAMSGALTIRERDRAAAAKLCPALRAVSQLGQHGFGVAARLGHPIRGRDAAVHGDGGRHLLDLAKGRVRDTVHHSAFPHMAVAQQLRVIEHGRDAGVVLVIEAPPLVPRLRLEHRAQARPHRIGVCAGYLIRSGQVFDAEDTAELFTRPWLDSADEDEKPVGGPVHPGAGMAAEFADGARIIDARPPVVLRVVAEQGEHRVLDGNAEPRAAASGLPLLQGRQDPDGRVETGHGVTDGQRGDSRLAACPAGRGRQPAHGLIVLLVPAEGRIRASLREAGYPRVDDVWLSCPDSVVVDAQALGGTRREAFHDGVRGGDEVIEDLPARRLLEVQDDAPLVPAVPQPPRMLGGCQQRQLAMVRRTRSVNLDYVGPEVGEDGRAELDRGKCRDLENPHTSEQFLHGGVLIPAIPGPGSLPFGRPPARSGRRHVDPQELGKTCAAMINTRASTCFVLWVQPVRLATCCQASVRYRPSCSPQPMSGGHGGGPGAARCALMTCSGLYYQYTPGRWVA